LKENVIVGKRIPAGTGMRSYNKQIVGPKDEIMTSFED
jgi:DNA-directed RNA polymerase subunit beta'